MPELLQNAKFDLRQKLRGRGENFYQSTVGISSFANGCGIV